MYNLNTILAITAVSFAKFKDCDAVADEVCDGTANELTGKW